MSEDKTKDIQTLKAAFEISYNAAYDFKNCEFLDIATGGFYIMPNNEGYSQEINRDWIAFQEGWQAAKADNAGTEIQNLKMLIFRLARKHPDEKLAAASIDYLHRAGLITPLDILRAMEPINQPNIGE